MWVSYVRQVRRRGAGYPVVRHTSWRRADFLAVTRHVRRPCRYWVSLAALFAGKDTQSSDDCAVRFLLLSSRTPGLRARGAIPWLPGTRREADRADAGAPRCRTATPRPR
jgi:hypothetical protein